MTKYTLITALSLLLILASPLCGYAYLPPAESPEGEWLVKDQTAHIRIASCGQKLWGTISWAKTPGKDEHNPDPARRNESVLGLPILLGLQPGKPNQWNGEIYNADNGKTYTGSITLKTGDTLHIEGCVLGFLCGGENWSRIPASRPESTANLCGRLKNRYPQLF